MRRFSQQMVRMNTRLIIALIATLTIMALYSQAGRSDQLEPLTAKEQQDVVARWDSRP